MAINESDEERKSSYEKIDYRLRPAKGVERKMLANAFWRLAAFDKIERYRYIGMGSVYFNDFILFHKVLGIKKLISIEGEDNPEKQKRFKLNKPFRCIDLRFAWSTQFLWNSKTGELEVLFG